MLHRIKLPTYQGVLDAFLQFQLQLITFACTPAQSQPLTKDVVKCAFPGKVGEWFYLKLWPKGKPPTKLYSSLEAFVNHVTCNPSVGPVIIDAYTHDIVFHQHFEEQNFQFHYHLLLDQDTKKVVEPLLTACYQLLCDGFPVEGTEQKFDRRDLVEAFRNENKGVLAVCPMCDGKAPIHTRDRDRAEVDHFLPKSLYPFLSIHPYNLVPICSDCNGFKSNTDPLPTQGPLLDTFHPYAYPAIKEIDVQIIDGYKVHILDTVCREPPKKSLRHENLLRQFRLEVPWQDDYLQDVKDELTGRLQAIGMGCRDREEPLSEEIVRDELCTILQNYEKKVGMKKYYLLESSYACYALTHQEEIDELVQELMGKKL